MRKKKSSVKKSPYSFSFKKKCIFCKEKLPVDYKNVELLSRFINVKGKFTSRRINGNCAKHQRKLIKEIKQARFLALLPFVVK